MNFKVATLRFQDLVSKAVKGASNNKMIPLTSLMSIKLESGKLSLTTTDATNYVTVIQDKVSGDDFEIVVQADLFNKLVSKISSEQIELILHSNKLEVVGNGKYTIELPLDEDGSLIKFPVYKFNHESPKKIIKLSTIKLIVSANKASIATTMEVPCYTGYYFGDSVVTTNIYKVCNTDVKVFDKSVLLPPELINLLTIMSDENIAVQWDGDKVLFSTDTCVVFGYVMEGIEDFAIESITNLIKADFESMCKLPRQEIISVLDRIGLFVTDYDRNGLDLMFTNEGLKISNKQSTGFELIKYVSSEKFQPFVCSIDINMFKSQVSVQSGEVFELWYGSEMAIKMVSGKVTQIISLLEEDVADDGTAITADVTE